LHAVRLAQVEPGDQLFIGGGIIGFLCAAWTRIFGAAVKAFACESLTDPAGDAVKLWSILNKISS